MMMNKVAVPYPGFILGKPVACLVQFVYFNLHSVFSLFSLAPPSSGEISKICLSKYSGEYLPGGFNFARHLCHFLLSSYLFVGLFFLDEKDKQETFR